MMHNVNHAVFVLLLLLMRTLGLPVQPNNAMVARKVYSPPITAPPDGAVSATGASTTVTWDATGIPADLRYNGTLLLGFIMERDSEEHLDIDNPLATDVDLRTGVKRITFPENLPTRTSYIIVLLGDSGNKSPVFTIIARTKGASTAL